MATVPPIATVSDPSPVGQMAGRTGSRAGPPPLPPAAEPLAPPEPPPEAPPKPRATLPPVRPATPLVRTAAGVFRKEKTIPTDRGGEAEADQTTRRSIPAWLVSLIVHTVALILLALISLPVGQGIDRLSLEFGEATEAKQFDLQTFDLESNDATAETGESQDDSPVDTDVQSLLDSVELTEVSLDLPAEVTPIGVGGAAEISVPMFGGRSGAMKSALLATYGGNQDTIDAVERGLRWLARQQDAKTGSWSMKGPYEDGSFEENRTAATAMALLAFLGDGHTPLGETEYSQIVERGLRYLIRSQDRNGFFPADVRSDMQASYAHAQATIAMSEAYAMTRLSWLRMPAEAGLRYAVEAQSPGGGWRYRPGEQGDLSVTGWYVLALRSGMSADLQIDGLPLSRTEYFLKTVETDNGALYQYMPDRGAKPAMTATGLLCRMYMGWPRGIPELGEGIEVLMDEAPLDPKNSNVYYWYYATQVLHHYGGPNWVKWNAVMKDVLPEMQIKRGRESGSWSPQYDLYGEQAGRLYQTCLTLYCLEVYYRHLPLYQPEKHGGEIQR